MLVFIYVVVFYVRDPFANKPSSFKGYPVFIFDLYLSIYTIFNIFIAFYISLTSVNDIYLCILVCVFLEMTESNQIKLNTEQFLRTSITSAVQAKWLNCPNVHVPMRQAIHKKRNFHNLGRILNRMWIVVVDVQGLVDQLPKLLSQTHSWAAIQMLFCGLWEVTSSGIYTQWRNSYGLRVGKPAGTRAEGAPAGCPFTQGCLFFYYSPQMLGNNFFPFGKNFKFCKKEMKL